MAVASRLLMFSSTKKEPRREATRMATSGFSCSKETINVFFFAMSILIRFRTLFTMASEDSFLLSSLKRPRSLITPMRRERLRISCSSILRRSPAPMLTVVRTIPSDTVGGMTRSFIAD